ncbi:MAG: hypothetical protein ACYS7M_04635 [Planctomycetota bacterium]|jgi:hypothetical protein
MAQVDPATFGRNIHLLIGGFLALGVGFVLLLGAWTGVKAWIWRARQRRSVLAWLRETHRADGQMYPPHTEGICQACGRGHHRIYHPPSGDRLCPPCYEKSWRRSRAAVSQAE